jgi:hypothetical protein
MNIYTYLLGNGRKGSSCIEPEAFPLDATTVPEDVKAELLLLLGSKLITLTLGIAKSYNTVFGLLIL